MTKDTDQYRAAFEAWARDNRFSLARDFLRDDEYRDRDTQGRWESWIAAKSEASTEPSAPVDVHKCATTSVDAQDAADLTNKAESLDEKAENALLWCYRRMKSSYGRLPFIEEAVAGLRARRAGALTDDAKSRYSAYVAKCEAGKILPCSFADFQAEHARLIREVVAEDAKDAARWRAFRARDEFDDLDFTAFKDEFREDADEVIDAAIEAKAGSGK
jgi:hypothetical protein